MNPAEFAIKNRLICFIVILASCVGGWLAFDTMPRFEDPEFTIRKAIVITQYPGATPEEVANEVTDALESAVQQMQEVKEIKSQSAAGVSRITVEIKYKFSENKDDLQGVWAKLRNRINDAQAQLPPGALTSIVNDDFGDTYGLYYLITGDGFTPAQLHTYARSLRTELLSVPDVAKVALGGIQSEAIYIEISRQKASALGVSIDQIFNDLASQNSVAYAGNVQVGNRRAVILPAGSIDSVSALEDVIISTSSSNSNVSSASAILHLRDIATVRRDYQDPASFILRYNGLSAISLGVSNITGANVATMGRAIEARILLAESRRPVGIEVQEYYHQGKIVEAAVANFALNVGIALLIVLVTLFLFMGLKSALVIGAVLLLTIAATLATMNQVGIPMHRISLGALIIALGMLVDNAIVVTEGILVGTQAGHKKLAIAKDIVTRTKWPLLGGTIVGILAFAPIGLAPGSTAEYTGHLFWVVMISLFYSWVFAITAVPLFADLLFKEKSSDEITEAKDGRFLLAYKGFMRNVLNFRWAVIGIVVAMFVASIWGFQFVKSGFFPASTTPQLVIDYWLPEGTDLSQTNADMTEIESMLMGLDGVVGVNTMVGQGTLRYMLVYPPESPNTAYGQFLLKAENFELLAGLIPIIQNHLDTNYPDAQAKVWRFQLGPGGGSKIEAEFGGPDPVVLRRLANEAKSVMAADGRLLSIKDDWRQEVSVIRPLYSETRGRRLGISREDLANALMTNYSGRNVGVYREGDQLIPIIARAPAAERGGAESMGSIQIPSSATGNTVPLSETVDGFETTWQNSQLTRLNRIWTIKAQADPLPGELPSIALARLMPEIEAIPLPSGYTMRWRGEYGDSQDSNNDLASALPMGFLAMVLVVIILFNALKQPLIIWLAVPLALIGVVPGLLLTNSALEFMAILGLLSLSGLLIKNAIVLVDQMDLEIKEGKPRFDAVIDSAASRVRPVSMGALTTVLGVIPLFGDAFFKAMAVVLVFGLSFATILTLVVIPALYAVFFKIKNTETQQLTTF